MNIEQETPLQRRLKLDARIVDLQQLLDDAVKERNKIEKDCNHVWGDTKYVPIRHEGYHSPGDPEGTMGVDRQLPFDVPARTEHWWERVCDKCGKLERTDRTSDQVKKVPKFI